MTMRDPSILLLPFARKPVVVVDTFQTFSFPHRPDFTAQPAMP